MIRNGEASLEASAARLGRALDALEARWAEARAARSEAAPGPVDDDALHAELREARMRERALESAAAEASAVLGRSAERIRAALEDEDPVDDVLDDGADAADEGEAPNSLDHLSDDQTDMHPTPAREF
jgi:hypothetical protein